MAMQATARGRLVTLEGGEAAGKSTQVRLLGERLRARGLPAVETREPGGSPFAERLRDVVLAERPAAPEAEFLVFAAARADHLSATIRPALAAGRWVICDRFIDSTRVYQGDLNGVDLALIRHVEAAVVGADMPDLTLVLDLPLDEALARMRSRGGGNRFDAALTETHRRLRDGFLAIAAAEPRRCVVIEASGGPEEVGDAIWRAVEARLLT
ncbi:MAG: dTMP kinase [Hyphomicrobiaceae bacterium]